MRFYVLFILLVTWACKSNQSSNIKEALAESRATEEEFDEIDDENEDSANPFDKLDTVPGKLILSGSFMQQYDEDFFNIGFSVFKSEDSAFFVHTILSQIVVDLSTGISEPQAVDPNDPEAIPLKIVEEDNGNITYKSNIRAWPDTYVITNAKGKIFKVSLQKPVTKLVQDPTIELKDHTYSGRRARIVIDTDI